MACDPDMRGGGVLNKEIDVAWDTSRTGPEAVLCHEMAGNGINGHVNPAYLTAIAGQGTSIG